MKSSSARKPRAPRSGESTPTVAGLHPRGPVKTRPRKRPAPGGSTRARPGDAPTARWDLRLYIAGETSRSRAAVENLRKICERYLDSDYSIEVIDLLKNPSLARGDQIVALPTLVRKIPVPMRKIIGDLSNTERVLVGLDLRARGD